MSKSNNPQTFLKSLLIIQTIAVLIYTGFAVTKQGWILFDIFTNNMTALDWNGQFNLDFACYLLLSGMWIMWRHKFSIPSIIFAIVAIVIGIMAFAPYLVFLLTKEKGNIQKLLTGNR